MKWVIERLEMEMNAIIHCLEDKDWASTGSDYHKDVRFQYNRQRLDLKEAISILKNGKKNKL